MKDNPAAIVAAASAGAAAFIKEFLMRHPKKVLVMRGSFLYSSLHFLAKVDDKVAGTAAIHIAAISGHIEVMKTIIEFKPDLEVEVNSLQ